MMLRIIGLILVILLVIGIYTAFADKDAHRCNYSQQSQDTECYDPR